MTHWKGMPIMIQILAVLALNRRWTARDRHRYRHRHRHKHRHRHRQRQRHRHRHRHRYRRRHKRNTDRTPHANNIHTTIHPHTQTTK